ncbi:MAG: hypothetical protein NZM25_02970 [Leptospiraceae bacterium]|nr:hypothetical protein [Leptospiraceae bacterium]MDW8307231.1 hypothetical protein [Leptospiraceae bacterium]
MKEIDYQALFEDLQEAGSVRYQKAWAILQEQIYLYPVRRYGMTYDVGGDFYLFFYPKLPSLIKDYAEKKAHYPFDVYLSVRLHYYFRKFLGRRKNPRRHKFDQLDWDDQRVFLLDEKMDFFSPRKILQEVLAELPDEERITVKLAYGIALDLKELRWLCLAHKSVGKAFSLYRSYLAEVEELREQQAARLRKWESFFEKSMVASRNKDYLRNQARQKMIEVLTKVGKIRLKTVAQLMREHQSTTGRRLQLVMEKLKALVREKVATNYGK